MPSTTEFNNSIGHIPHKLKSIILDGVLPFDEIEKYKDIINASGLNEKFYDLYFLKNIFD